MFGCNGPRRKESKQYEYSAERSRANHVSTGVFYGGVFRTTQLCGDDNRVGSVVSRALGSDPEDSESRISLVAGDNSGKWATQGASGEPLGTRAAAAENRALQWANNIRFSQGRRKQERRHGICGHTVGAETEWDDERAGWDSMAMDGREGAGSEEKGRTEVGKTDVFVQWQGSERVEAERSECNDYLEGRKRNALESRTWPRSYHRCEVRRLQITCRIQLRSEIE